MMSREDYRGIADVICDHDLLLISDEIYTEMTYDGEMTSAVQADGLQERTILINGFSKSYAMTGWRVAISVRRKNSATPYSRFISM